MRNVILPILGQLLVFAQDLGKQFCHRTNYITARGYRVCPHVVPSPRGKERGTPPPRLNVAMRLSWNEIRVRAHASKRGQPQSWADAYAQSALRSGVLTGA